MPLFGRHHKNTEPAGRRGHHDEGHNNASTAGPDYDNQRATVGELYGTNDHNDGRYPPGPAQGLNHNTTAPTNDPYTNAPHQQHPGGPGAGPGADPQLPPTSHINPSAESRSGGGGSRLAGKVEHAVGSLVGSQALKEQGFRKEHEAGAFKMQSAEIAEAERLEKEALIRRERAVAHGAHPENAHLGGTKNGNTLSDLSAGGPYGSDRL